MARKRNELNVSAGIAASPHRATERRVRKPAAAAAPAVEAQPVQAAKSASCEPSRTEIAQLAYSYWEARGRQDGSAHEDWLRAESELRAKAASV